MKTKKGFTLAETLIAMAILGILTAITVPTLITTTNKITYVDGLKRAYLTIKTATDKIALNNNGSMVNIVSNGDSIPLRDKYCSQLNCIKKCDYNVTGCFHSQSEMKLLNNQSILGTYNPTISSWHAASAILSNGMTLVLYADDFTPASTSQGWLAIDVNGFKKPNILGRDVFSFEFTSTNIKPNGSKWNPDYTVYCDPASTDDENGAYCSSRVLSEGGMNY